MLPGKQLQRRYKRGIRFIWARLVYIVVGWPGTPQAYRRRSPCALRKPSEASLRQFRGRPTTQASRVQEASVEIPTLHKKDRMVLRASSRVPPSIDILVSAREHHHPLKPWQPAWAKNTCPERPRDQPSAAPTDRPGGRSPCETIPCTGCSG